MIDTHAHFQHALVRALHDPEAPLPTGVEPRRAAIYRRLLRNNVGSFIDACFPVLRGMLGTVSWQVLIDTFFRDSRCHSPLFRDIPGAFNDWLGSDASHGLPDWALELADYEHAELRAEVHPASVQPQYAPTPELNWLEMAAMLNPTAELLSYRHPVHRYGPEAPPPELEAEAPPTCLIIWRDAHHEVCFMETSAAALLLLEPLAAAKGERINGQVLLTRFAARIGQHNADALAGHCQALMQSLHTAGIVWPTAN